MLELETKQCIKGLFQSGKTQKEIGVMFNISQQQVSKVLRQPWNDQEWVFVTKIIALAAQGKWKPDKLAFNACSQILEEAMEYRESKWPRTKGRRVMNEAREQHMEQ